MKEKELEKLCNDYADRMWRSMIYGDAAGNRKRFANLLECFAVDVRCDALREKVAESVASVEK